MPEMPDVSFWMRAAALVALMGCVAAVDLWCRRDRARRWKEYLFILATGCAGAVFGAMTDLITSSISPEYFIFGKELPEEGLCANAMLLGLQAGFSAGIIAGALCLFVGMRKRTAAIKMPKVMLLAWRPLLLAIVLGALAPFVFSWFDPFGFVEHLTRPLGLETAERFLRVWHIHLGVYLGLGLGLMWMIAKLLKLPVDSAK
jgi:hypothetical protein